MNNKPITIDLLHPTVVGIFKNWGYISFFGALALLITLLFFSISYAADLQKEKTQNHINNPPISGAQPLGLAPLPTVNIEATVISLALDLDELGCANRCLGTDYPRDRAMIRIDSLNQVNDPQQTIGLRNGDIIEVKFNYSAHPARLVRVQQVDQRGPNGTISHTTFLGRPIPIENGFFIYGVLGAGQAEVMLPGLQVDNQIQVNAFNPVIGINQYEIIH